ncbi:MAG: YncE family protein [Bacteroidota bacterium]
MKMKTVKKTGVFYLTVCLMFMFQACEKDNDGPNESSKVGPYTDGIFFTNEGAWGANNGSIGFYSSSGDSVVNEVFAQENDGFALGDVVQSAATYGDEAWIVVNASNSIYTADRHSMKAKEVIEELNNPRYLAFHEESAYLTEWGHGGVVLKIDTTSLLVTDTIDVGTGPERMLVNNNELWVANSGAYTRDSVVTVIDLTNDNVTASIISGDNPVDLVKDLNGDIWVLCVGYVEYAADFSIALETGSKLVQVNGNTKEVMKEMPISETQHPTNLEIDKAGENLYIGGGYGFPGVYKVSITDTQFPAEAFIDKSAYGLGYDNDSESLYVFEAPTFTDAGVAYRYNNAGELLSTFETGIGPNGLAKNY